MPSLGLGLGDLWAKEPLGSEDDDAGGTPFCFLSDSERKSGICVYVCMCMPV